MILIHIQFSFNVLNSAFSDVFKLINDVVNEIDIDMLSNAIFSGFEKTWSPGAATVR